MTKLHPGFKYSIGKGCFCEQVQFCSGSIGKGCYFIQGYKRQQHFLILLLLICVCVGERGESLLLSLFYITLFFFPCAGTVIIQNSLCFFLFRAGGIKTEEQIVRCIRKDVNARMDAKGLTSNSILDTVHQLGHLFICT